MSEKPKYLSRAVLKLWHSNADGSAPDGDPIFLGAAAENLKLAHNFTAIEARPTGVPYRRVRHVDEHHVIEIERIWATDETRGEFTMERGRNYILEIKWVDDEDEDVWFSRTYFGVTNNSADLTSQSINESLQNQVFGAQYFVPDQS